VRDVLAHCGAALTRVATDRLHAFTPGLNEIDVAERREWPLPENSVRAGERLPGGRDGHRRCGRKAGCHRARRMAPRRRRPCRPQRAAGLCERRIRRRLRPARRLDPPQGSPAGRAKPARRRPLARPPWARPPAGHSVHRPRHFDADIRRPAPQTCGLPAHRRHCGRIRGSLRDRLRPDRFTQAITPSQLWAAPQVHRHRLPARPPGHRSARSGRLHRYPLPAESCGTRRGFSRRDHGTRASRYGILPRDDH
jgi:hypothetical protein